MRRFVHTSSLAAREPDLSRYGRSKAAAERLVQASGLDWTIVRPPGVYGPGDMDQRDLFRAAKWGIVPLPPAGRLSIIHVDDLARLLVALVETADPSAIYEPEQPDGPLTHAAFARAIGGAVGRRVLPLHLPPPLLRLAARGDRLLRGSGARLTADRVAYMIHPDWTADPAKRPPPTLWTRRDRRRDRLGPNRRVVPRPSPAVARRCDCDFDAPVLALRHAVGPDNAWKACASPCREQLTAWDTALAQIIANRLRPTPIDAAPFTAIAMSQQRITRQAAPPRRSTVSMKSRMAVALLSSTAEPGAEVHNPKAGRALDSHRQWRSRRRRGGCGLQREYQG